MDIGLDPTTEENTMLKVTMTLAGAAVALAAVPAAAQESLNVQGVVAPYCSVRLANVSSGTATVAFESEQKIANLQVACNSGAGTTLTVNPQQGDLVGAAGRINYAFRLTSSVAPLNIATTDTAPGDVPDRGIFIRRNPGYSQSIANGLPLELFMNVNVNAVPGEAPDFSGSPLFPANAAPAGTYSETFNFTISGV